MHSKQSRYRFKDGVMVPVDKFWSIHSLSSKKIDRNLNNFEFLSFLRSRWATKEAKLYQEEDFFIEVPKPESNGICAVQEETEGVQALEYDLVKQNVRISVY